MRLEHVRNVVEIVLDRELEILFRGLVAGFDQ